LNRIKNGQTVEEPGVKVGQCQIFDENTNLMSNQGVLLPDTILNAIGQTMPISSKEFTVLPNDTTFGRKRYTFPDGFEVTMSVVLMKSDRSSIHQPQVCLVCQGWSIDKSEVIHIKIDRPYPYELSATKMSTSISLKNQGDLHGIYIYWFVSKDKLAAGHFERFWSMLKSSFLKGAWQRWAYISCFATCAPGDEEITFQRMKAIIAASVPEFQIPAGAPLKQ